MNIVLSNLSSFSIIYKIINLFLAQQFAKFKIMNINYNKEFELNKKSRIKKKIGFF